MFPFKLRDYQQKAVSDTYKLIRQSTKRILLFAPTGGGKTIISTKIVYDAVSRKRRVLFVVHRDILVRQTYSKFSTVGLECGFFKAGWEENINAPVQIASIQTLPNRDAWQKSHFDLIVFDECHLVAFSKICRLMMKSFFPNAIYIGLTATPWRLSKKESLGDIFECLVKAPMPKQLIEWGFLVKPSYYSLNFEVILDEVEIVNGDYDQQQLSTIYDRPELIDDLCNNWFDLAYKRSSIAFTTSVRHAENIAQAFSDRGISAAAVTGKTPIPKRNNLFAQLATGKLLVLASCGALSEGFDVPQVSCVIPARPTKSKALYFQQLGRGFRLAENKHDCIILDQSQNVIEHGFIEDLEDVELAPSGEQICTKREGKPPLKACPLNDGGCGRYISSHHRRCPECGYDFELKKLIRILGKSRLTIASDREKLALYRNLLRQAYQNRYAPSWAAVKFKEEYGFFPPFDWGRGAIFNHQKSRDCISAYRAYLFPIAQRSNKDADWIEKYLYLEFGID